MMPYLTQIFVCSTILVVMMFNIEQKKEFYRLIGEKIKERRNERGWLQEDLAARVGLARTTLVNIENGNQSMSLHSFIMISKTLGCNFDEMLPNLDVIAEVGRSDVMSMKKVPPIAAGEIRNILEEK